MEIVHCVLDIFEDKFARARHKKKIKFIIMTWIKKRDKIKNWLYEKEECVEHRTFILEKLLTCKMFKKCKDFLVTGQSKLAKLKILTHI